MLSQRLRMNKSHLAFQGATEVFLTFRLMFVGIEDFWLNHSRSFDERGPYLVQANSFELSDPANPPHNFGVSFGDRFSE